MNNASNVFFKLYVPFWLGLRKEILLWTVVLPRLDVRQAEAAGCPAGTGEFVDQSDVGVHERLKCISPTQANLQQMGLLGSHVGGELKNLKDSYGCIAFVSLGDISDRADNCSIGNDPSEDMVRARRSGRVGIGAPQ